MDRGHRFKDPEDHYPGFTGNLDRLVGCFHGSNDVLTELTEELRLTVLTEVFGLTKIFGLTLARLTGLTELTELTRLTGLTELTEVTGLTLGLTLTELTLVGLTGLTEWDELTGWNDLVDRRGAGWNDRLKDNRFRNDRKLYDGRLIRSDLGWNDRRLLIWADRRQWSLDGIPSDRSLLVWNDRRRLVRNDRRMWS